MSAAGSSTWAPGVVTGEPPLGYNTPQMVDLSLSYRAIDLADEFQTAEVIGVDLAPIQPRYVLLPSLHFPMAYLLSLPARYQRTARALAHSR